MKKLALLVVFAAAGIASAQTAAIPAERLEKMDKLLDGIRSSIHAGDIENANRMSTELVTAVYNERKQQSPAQRLAGVEKLATGTNEQERQFLLSRLAYAAFEASDWKKATAYASEAIESAKDPKSWNYGNAIFHGNTVLGRIAIARDHNVAMAKERLLASVKGEKQGSPQLNSFGPNMSLAKDLIQAGERASVLEFFDGCRGFWKRGQKQLDEWSATVKGGGMPDFSANLEYGK